MELILVANGSSFAVSDVVVSEAQFVLRGGPGDDARERDSVDLNPLLAVGLLEVISTDVEEELHTFIDLLSEIDEGEAMTAALAIHRAYVVVTDDRKASRVLSRHGVKLLTSLDLIRAWGTSPNVSQVALRTALSDLRQRGNYDPPRTHPLRDWWDEVGG